MSTPTTPQVIPPRGTGPHKLACLWNRWDSHTLDPDADPVELYRFETRAELLAFMMGIDVGGGLTQLLSITSAGEREIPFELENEDDQRENIERAMARIERALAEDEEV